jgi:hypothetical protein
MITNNRRKQPSVECWTTDNLLSTKVEAQLHPSIDGEAKDEMLGA